MKHILLVLLVLSVFVWLKRDRVPSGPYVYDEADYMYAASLGVAANAFDSPSRSIVDFISIGWVAFTRRSATASTSLSQLARTGVDVNFYRHTHGPFYHYWLVLFRTWAQSEQAVRRATLFFPVLTTLVIYFGCLRLLPVGQNTPAAILGSALFLWSPTTLSSGEIAPHLAFALCVLTSLFCAAGAISQGSRRLWYAGLAAAAVAFCTLEVAFALVLALIATAWLGRDQLGFDRPLLLRSIGVFAGTVLLVWPAAIFKLAFLKSYLFMAYLAVARKSPWGETSFAETWRVRFASSPFEWALIASALLIFFLRRPRARQAWPFLTLVVLMVLAVLRVKTGFLRYALPFQPSLEVASAIILAGFLASWRPLARTVAISLTVALLALNAYRFVSASPALPDHRVLQVLNSVRTQNLDEKQLLVPQSDLPSLHYYFPSARLVAITDSLPLDRQLQSEHYDAVLRPGQSQFETTAAH